MKYVDIVAEAFQEVYSGKKYYAITGIFAFVFFSLNVLVRNYKLLFSNFTLIFSLIAGSWASMSLYAFIMLIIISLLTGIVLALSIYLIRRQVASSVGVGLSGIAVGIIAPACPSCAIGLLSVLGLGGFLSILPFKGVELGVIAVMLLVASIILLSNKVNTKVCDVTKK